MRCTNLCHFDHMWNSHVVYMKFVEFRPVKKLSVDSKELRPPVKFTGGTCEFHVSLYTKIYTYTNRLLPIRRMGNISRGAF
jgi:hypothetical protein